MSRIVDVLFPPRCVGCGRFGAHFCGRCRPTPTPDEMCPQCGMPMPGPILHAACAARTGIDGVVTLGVYDGPLAQAIRQLKFRQVAALARTLGQALGEKLRPVLPPTVQVIVPTPLHPSRERERGYNQAALLARATAEALDRPVATLLVRTRATGSQTRLSRAARRHNVSGAFAATGRVLGGVAVLDDVLTTGSTLSACAIALRAAGAESVWAIAVARAQWDAAPPPTPSEQTNVASSVRSPG